MSGSESSLKKDGVVSPDSASLLGQNWFWDTTTSLASEVGTCRFACVSPGLEEKKTEREIQSISSPDGQA
jgi:hypothetical protein